MNKKIKLICSIYIVIMFIFILPSYFSFFGQVLGVSPGEEIRIPTERNGEKLQQTCVDYEAEDREYEFAQTNQGYDWDKTSNQYKINQIWVRQGKTVDPDTHWAYITTGSGEKRYLIALTSTFGQAGDYVDVYVSKEGTTTVFPCIMGDTKSSSDGAFFIDGVDYGDVSGERLKVVEIMINNYDGTQHSHHNTGVDQTLVNNISEQLSQLYPVVKVKNGGSYLNSQDGSQYLDGSYGSKSSKSNFSLKGMLGKFLRAIPEILYSAFENFMTDRTDSTVMYDILTPAEKAAGEIPYYGENNVSNSDVCKILFFGNSYIFANDFGAQLAAISDLQGKRVVIVSATHSNHLVENELAANCWDNQLGTIQLITDGIYKFGNRNFDDIVQNDWGNLQRPGQWDYIISFEQDQYDRVKDCIPNSKRFISLDSSNYDSKFSYVSEDSIMRQYGKNIAGSDFLMSDYEKHPTVFKQYFRAMIIYAKIFGINGFPTTEEGDRFIKFYNEDNKELRDNEIYKEIMVEYRMNDSTFESRSITKEKARKVQYLVYKNYQAYLNN